MTDIVTPTIGDVVYTTDSVTTPALLRPMAVTRLRVDDAHQLRVFIWPDMATLQKATGHDDAGACWKAPEIVAHVDGDGNISIITRLVGSLHFYNNGFGGGVFAHELQHFIQDWIAVGSIDIIDPEAVPTLAGDLTDAFWIWFYDHFKVNNS